MVVAVCLYSPVPTRSKGQDELDNPLCSPGIQQTCIKVGGCPLIKYPRIKIKPLGRILLQQWRKSNNHRLWQIAKCMEMAERGANRQEIIDKVESSYKTIAQWLSAYRSKGLKGFEFGPNPRNRKQTEQLKDRKAKILKFIHESPKLLGLNRTSWSIRLVCNGSTTSKIDDCHWNNIRYVKKVRLFSDRFILTPYCLHKLQR